MSDATENRALALAGLREIFDEVRAQWLHAGYPADAVDAELDRAWPIYEGRVHAFMGFLGAKCHNPPGRDGLAIGH